MSRGSLAAWVWCCVVVLALAGGERAQAKRYYVDTSGSDRRSGSSPSRAWRTVDRVNRASLEPGDLVLFRGGRRFDDAPLIPGTSGSRRARIRYASFGGGSATLTRGVFLISTRWITIDGLRIRGAEQGIGSGGEGSGARHIDLLRNKISDVQIGINAPNVRDSAWRIADNHITRTGDSGLIIEGADFKLISNRITSTGIDSGISYGKHGIYATGPRLAILRNRIARFASEGISTRFRDALIAGNVIEGGEGGIGYYADDPEAGTTVIRGNRIARVDYGIYIAPAGAAGPTRERFRIVANTIRTRGGSAIDAPGGQSRVVASLNYVLPLSSSERRPSPGQAGRRPDEASSGGGRLPWFGAAAGLLVLVVLAVRRIRS